MKIKIKQLVINNFKGIKSLIIDFTDLTNIEGANRAGKSTVFDALTWLLFGKNSEDKKEFSIKPFNGHGETVPKLENEVCGVFEIDGQDLKLNRIQREKWTKKHGTDETILTGNETIYNINDIPKKQKEYQFKIDSLVDESLFKLVTNPLYFNSLHWEKRREMLIGLTDQKSDIDTLRGMQKPSAELLKLLNQGDEIEEITKGIKAQIKKIKDALKIIPIQIGEVERGKPEAQNWTELFNLKLTKENELKTIENAIHDKSKALTDFNNSRLDEQKALNSIQTNLNEFVSKFKIDQNKDVSGISVNISNAEAEKDSAERDIVNTAYKIKSLKSELLGDETEKALLLNEYKEGAKETFVFDENETKCKVCLQELPNIEDKKAKFESNFNISKKVDLDKKLNKGLELKSTIERKTKDLAQFEAIMEKLKNGVLTTLESEIKELKQYKKASEEISYKDDNYYIQINKDYSEAKTKFEAVKAPTADKTELLNEKSFKLSEIEQIKTQLRVKEQIETAETRIKELATEEKAKATELMELEKTEFAIDNFIKHKMSAIELEINQKFKYVSFKMFESQINGGEKPACITLFNGVPYSDANSEAKINGGLDIINTFSEFYNISAPIFIDNREGVTELIEIEAQLINLIVNPIWSELKVDPTSKDTTEQIRHFLLNNPDLKKTNPGLYYNYLALQSKPE